MNNESMQSLLNQLKGLTYRLSTLNQVIYGPQPEPDTVAPTPIGTMAIVGEIQEEIYRLQEEIKSLEKALLTQAPGDSLGYATTGSR